MSLPQAVLDQEARANALHAQVYGTPEGEAAPPPEAPPAPEPPPPEPPKPDDKWEHRYKVLEGKYKAEVPRLAADNRELRQKLNQALADIEDLKNRPTQDTLIKPEDREKYGDDLLDVIKRAAKEETAVKDVEIQTLKKKLDNFETTAAKNTEMEFYNSLSNAVPDWPTLNNDEGFLNWLDEHDELTGQKRQDLLDAAYSAYDANRVARFFKAYTALTQKNVQSSQSALAAQVAPESGRVQTPPPGKRTWTRGEVKSFYDQCRQGKVSEKDMVAIEAEIQMAAAEGRIR